MKLSKDTPCQTFTIWQPRWRDKKVLLAAFKVGTHNLITFTKAPTYPDTYYVSGEKVRACTKGNNGKIPTYEVPLDYLELLERE